MFRSLYTSLAVIAVATFFSTKGFGGGTTVIPVPSNNDKPNCEVAFSAAVTVTMVDPDCQFADQNQKTHLLCWGIPPYTTPTSGNVEVTWRTTNNPPITATAKWKSSP